jgi:hypothetical protein
MESQEKIHDKSSKKKKLDREEWCRKNENKNSITLVEGNIHIIEQEEAFYS